MSRRIIFYSDGNWALGAIHSALVAALNARGWSTELLDWSVPYGIDHFKQRVADGAFIVTLPHGGTAPLTNSYGVPHDRIYAVAHGEPDLHTLIRHGSTDVFERFAGYGVVSDNLLCSSLSLGIRRIPSVLRLGIDTARYAGPLPTQLESVGYGGVMNRLTEFGIDCKRGNLAQAAAQGAGLNFAPAVNRAFRDMHRYYHEVQAVLMPSLQEGAGLPPLEAAAAGRLVIGTPVGQFPRLAYEGLGLLAPISSSGFISYCVTALKYFAQNPNALRDKSAQIRAAAQQRDWRYVLPDWEEFLSN